MTLDDYFAGYDESRRLFDALQLFVAGLGASEVRVTESQVSFRRSRAFAYAWVPERHLGPRAGLAPLVLTVGLRRRDASVRWKEVVEPYPGRFTHHLELWFIEDLDDEVIARLREAWAVAG